MEFTSIEWTKDKIAILTRMWAEGFSASQIGREIGVSRNAVLGKRHRLNLPGRPHEEKNIARIRRERRVPSPHGNAGSRLPRPKPYTPKEPLAPVIPFGIDLLDLKRNQCRFASGSYTPPFDDEEGPFTFCGHKVQPGKSYCPAHCQIVYQAPSERPKENPRFSAVVRKNTTPKVIVLAEEVEEAA